MHTGYAATFDLPADSADEATAIVSDEMSGTGFGRADLSVDGRLRLRNQTVTWRTEPGRAFECDFTERADDGRTVTVSLHLQQERRKVRAVVVRRTRVPSGSPDGIDLEPAPAIVRRLLAELDAADGDEIVHPEVVEFGPQDVDLLVAELTDPDRRLPVVVLSCAEDGLLGLEPVDAVRYLAGQAHLRLLTPGAPRVLSAAVGDYRSVYGGALRVYRPGFTATSTSREHRYWSRETLRGNDRLVLEWLRFHLTASAVARLPELGPVTRLREATGGARELLDMADALDTAQRELDAITSRLAAAQSRIRELESAGGEYSTLLEATEAAAADFPVLVWLDDAFESAAESPYARPDRAYAVLETLAEAAQRYADGDLPGGFDAYFEQAGVRFGRAVSTQAKARWPHEYRRRWKGEEIWLDPHLKVGSGPPDRCLRIYWYMDEAERTLVVGHVGRHLTDLATNG